MKESKIEKLIKEYIKSKYPNSYITKGNSKYHRGVADIIACIHGEFIAIEVKTQKGKIRENQLIHQKLVHNAGGYTAIIRNIEELKQFLEEIDL